MDDYINHYDLYNKNSLDSISTYITSLFNNNNIKLDYDGMKIVCSECCKGINLYECKKK